MTTSFGSVSSSNGGNVGGASGLGNPGGPGAGSISTSIGQTDSFGGSVNQGFSSHGTQNSISSAYGYPFSGLAAQESSISLSYPSGSGVNNGALDRHPSMPGLSSNGGSPFPNGSAGSSQVLIASIVQRLVNRVSRSLSLAL